MQYPKLELHITQVERLIAKSRKKFFNKKKENIYNNMLLLFDAIKRSDYANFKSQELLITKHALDIVFYGIEFLDYKSESEIPKRLIFCLNQLLDEWIPGGTEDYFIVVSYNKNPSDFSIRAFDQGQLITIKTMLKQVFGVDYSQSLIQISKPKFLANDYLSSIPIYHELGHFIEKNYQVVKTLSREPDFPLLKISALHFTEFFADLFAAQYIGRSAIAPLDESVTKDTITHPSNSLRVEVVNSFIEGTGNRQCMSIINELNRVTQIRTGLNLQVRYENLEDKENPFIDLLPKVIKDPRKLHTLFNAGWQYWMDPNSMLRKKYPNYLECSKVINRLIRNSIKLTMQQTESNRLKKLGNYFGNLANKYGIIDN
jgi:hypothetical protein